MGLGAAVVLTGSMCVDLPPGENHSLRTGLKPPKSNCFVGQFNSVRMF